MNQPLTEPIGPTSSKRLRTLLLGAGSLGRAFLRRLRDQGAPVDLVGVVTAHHGRRLDPAGFEAAALLGLIETEGLGEHGPNDFKKMLELTKPDVVVECIPQNIRSGEPALGYMRTTLDQGVHLVTANKAPIVLGYRDLLHRASRTGAKFRFEATVLDGLPIFTFLSQLQGAKVTRVRGVLNATSSVVLESVQLGSTRSRGLARAQAQGIAEADSVLDLDGWDAAAKLALLANVWMGGALRIVDVARSGCDSVKDEKIRQSAEAGAHYRLVGEVVRQSDGVIRAQVEPAAIEPNDPLYSLKGSCGGLTIETDQGHQFTLLQQVAGIDDAASGLVHDLKALLAGLPQV